MTLGSSDDGLISDISPLANLINLQVLTLERNRISDISALVKNEGIGEGDKIDLRYNCLVDDQAQDNIQELKNRGAVVSADPQDEAKCFN